MHVTARKWRTGAAEIARLRDSLRRSQVISSVYAQPEADAEIAPGVGRLCQHCNGHTQVSAQAAAAFVRMYCGAMIIGRQYACDACSHSARMDAASIK
jgi:hypothetical protein